MIIMMVMWMMTLNDFTVGKFDLSPKMKMVRYTVLFVINGIKNYVRSVMTKMISFFANFVHKACVV